MQELLPYYEQELAFLRRQSEAFARQYPRVAGRLTVSGDLGDDPHVERMIQSFALLSARAHKRLDDDFPLFTETLLEVLYPHYLRPFPACAIAQFEPAPGQGSAACLPRGSLLQSRPVQGVICHFRTSAALQLTPLRIEALRFSSAVLAPQGTRLPPQVSGVLSLSLLWEGEPGADAAPPEQLRLYLDGETSTVCALRQALSQHSCALYLQTPSQDGWQALAQQGDAQWQPQLAGFGEEEALLPADARSNAAYRLLTEYLSFPPKFQFLDLPLQRCWRALGGQRRFTLHYLLSGVRADGDAARLLQTVSADNLRLGCVPVVNLFPKHADPVRVDHSSSDYAVLPDGRRPAAYEVHSLCKVQRVRKTEAGEQVQTLRPFYGLDHADGAGSEGAGLYYHLRRDAELAQLSPGHETRISLVDPDFDPAQVEVETLSIDLLATNRDWPSQLAIGHADGDLLLEGGGTVSRVRLLMRPTPSYRFKADRGALWRLISHLSLNHLSLSQGGLEALKDMLRLYDLPRSPVNRRLIDALIEVRHRSATAWMAGQPFASFVRGTEIELLIDEDGYVGSGVDLLAAVLDRFFGLFTHVNSFTRLTLRGHRSQQPICTCPARSGWQALV